MRHQAEARRLYAAHIRKLGPGYLNLASTIEAGTAPTLWVGPALGAIEEALRDGPREDDAR